MKRWLGASIGLLAMTGLARADKELDDAVAKLSSRDRQVRQAAVTEIQAWADRFDQRFARLRTEEERAAYFKEFEAAKPHWDLICCEKYMAEVVEALADPRPNSVRAFLLKRFANPEGDMPVKWGREDETIGICGNYDRSPEYANRYVVSKRPDVARTLIADPKVGSRGALLMVLTELQRPEDDALAQRFMGSSNPSLRASAVWALAHYPVDRWLAPVSALAGDRDPEVRYAVASVLSKVEGDQAVPTLLRLLQDPYRKVAEAAHCSMPREEVVKSEEIERIYRQVWARHPHWPFAFEGIGTYATKASIDSLLAHWKAKGEGWDRVPGIILGVDPRLGRKLLLEGARASDPSARVAAIRDMAEVVGDDVEEAILARLSDEDEFVVSIALEVVEERKPAAAIPILREMLRKRQFPDREAVERVLNLCLGIPERNDK